MVPISRHNFVLFLIKNISPFTNAEKRFDTFWKNFLLNKIKSQPHATSYRRVSEITGIPKSTISRVLQQELHLLNRKHCKKNKLEHTKETRKEWSVRGRSAKSMVSSVSSRGVNIHAPIFKAKSEELDKKLGSIDFKATDGWLSRWKVRRNIKFRRSHGVKGSSDSESAELMKKTKISTFSENFSANAIFNADETGLYYRAIPDGFLCYKTLHFRAIKKRWNT